MKTRITALASAWALLSLAGCASQPQSDEQRVNAAFAPTLAAADFAAQVYGKEISVLLFDQSPNKARAQIRSPEGRICHLDLVLAPADVQTSRGWLISAVQCGVTDVSGASLSGVSQIEAEGKHSTVTSPFKYTKDGQAISCQEYWKAIGEFYASSQPNVKVTGLDRQCVSVK